MSSDVILAILGTILGWLLAGAMGYLLLACMGLPHKLRSSRRDLQSNTSFAGDAAILAGLSLLIGLGASAMLSWLRLQADTFIMMPTDALDCIFMAMLLVVLNLKQRFFPHNIRGKSLESQQATTSLTDVVSDQKSGKFGITLMLWGWLMVVITAAGVVVNIARRPWGDWDAIMIWTVRARFIDRAGVHWPDTFTLPAIHPDYPLLIPLSIHRLWQYPQVELQLGPQLVCVTFLLSCMLILWGVLRKCRGPVVAWLGLIVLIANPFFVNIGSLQLADVPQGTAFMAAWAMVLLASREYASNRSSVRWWVLAGVMFGLTLWIKNEGMMMLLASGVGLIVGWSVWMKKDTRKPRKRQLQAVAKRMVLPVFTGFLPFFIVWGWAKLTLTASNDLLRSQSQNSPLDKLVDVARHSEIVSAYGQMIAHHKSIWCSVILLLFVLVAGWGVGALGNAGRMLHGFAVAVILCMLGYYTVYLLSPYDLVWHLETSLSRLLTQFWPAFVLWAMMVVNADWLRAKR